jgi:hypothetical protein
LEDLLREDEALRRADAAAALAAARETMLLVLPPDVPPPSKLEAYPLISSERVSGRRFRAKGFSKEARRTAVVVGDEGVSVESAAGERSTVRFASCEAVLHWPDGSRTLYGRDGFRVHVDPSAWRHGKEAVASIDAEADQELAIVMERELSDRIASVEAVADEKLKRRWVVSEELEALPGMLDDGERVLMLAEANRGLRAGLLVITDRRFLWTYAPKPERAVDVPRHEIGSVRVREGGRMRDANLWVELRGEEIAFSDIVPKERAPEIRDLLAAN